MNNELTRIVASKATREKLKRQSKKRGMFFYLYTECLGDFLTWMDKHPVYKKAWDEFMSKRKK